MRLAATALAATCALATLPSHGAEAIRAMTEDGRRVVLQPDGRWHYDLSSPAHAPALVPPSPQAVITSPYQTPVKKISFAFDSSQWLPQPGHDGGDSAKLMFKHKTLPLYGMVIADQFPGTTDVVRNVIIANAKRASGAEPRLLLDETRDLNGKPVGSIRFFATLSGLDFIFSGTYYGDADGNVQVMCYTSQLVFYKYEADCNRFMSGLTIG